MNQAPFSINDSALAVELSDVWKSFPGVTANAGVNLSVRTGSIHALLGENGAEINADEHPRRYTDQIVAS